MNLFDKIIVNILIDHTHYGAFSGPPESNDETNNLNEHNLLQGLVVGTSPFVCDNLNN